MSTQHNSSTDFSDDDCNIVEDSQPLFPTKNRKRKTTTSPGVKNKKVKPVVMTLDEKKEAISLIDINHQLAIYQYINMYHQDVMVKVFVDQVIEYKILPILPSCEILKEWLSHDNIPKISDSSMCLLVDNFMKYFRLKYFNNNISKATENGKAVFNPKNNFFIPEFNFLPLKCHQEMNEAKTKYVQEVQNASVRGTQFLIQTFVLRNIDIIMQFIVNTEKVELQSEKQRILEYTLATAYTTAKMAFAKEYQIKVIDWTSYESKGKDTLPKWRKETDNVEPPQPSTAHFSKPIIQAIEKGNYKEGKALAKQYDEFLNGNYRRPSPRNRSFKKNTNSTQGNEASNDRQYRPRLQAHRRRQKGQSYQKSQTQPKANSSQQSSPLPRKDTPLTNKEVLTTLL